MSLTKTTSEVKHLSRPADEVYARLSDLRNLEALKTKFEDPEARAKLAERVPADKVEQIGEYVKTMTFTADTVTIQSPVGEVALRIIEREPDCIKMAGEGAPIELYVWIQILPEGEGSKMRVTVGAEVNFFMKAMISKPLAQAAEGLASIIAASVDGGGVTPNLTL